MQLFEYRSRLTGKQWDSFCEKLGCSPHYLYQIAKGADKVSKGAKKSGVRLAGADLCIKIEELTIKRSSSSRSYPGVVFRYDLRPDYWPAPKNDPGVYKHRTYTVEDMLKKHPKMKGK